MSFDGAKVRLFFHSRNTFRPLFAIKAPIVDIRHSTPTVVDIGQCESIYLNTETLRYRVYGSSAFLVGGIGSNPP